MSGGLGGRAVIYARLSRVLAANELNIGDQVARCKEYAAGKGWQVVEVVEDRGESAFDRDTIGDRPGMARVLELIGDRAVDVVLAWRPDRLWRDPIEAAMFLKDCHRHQVHTVATVMEGERDPGNPGDEMVATIIASVSRYESAAKSQRLRAKARQLAELGLVGGGGGRPFGYEPDRVTVVEAEAVVLREAVRRVIAGDTLRSITAWMNTTDVAPVGGGRWMPAIVRRTVMRARYAGLREHRGVVTAKAVWPAIISEDEFATVREILSDPARRLNRESTRYLLTGGIAVCGPCGSALVARPNGNGVKCYVCSVDVGGCGKIRRQAPPVDAEVVARLAVVLAEPPPVQPARPELRLVGVVDEISRLEERLTDLARDHYALQLITRAEYFAAREPITAMLDELRARTPPAPKPPRRHDTDLAAEWPGMSLDDQRALVADWVEAVRIQPAVKGLNRFDPTRIEVVWRA